MNPVIQSLYERKSVRAWQDREIPEEAVQTILEAAGQAPTAGKLSRRGRRRRSARIRTA